MDLASTFHSLRAKGEKALVLFVTAGDPPLDQLPAVLEALAEGGADVIELGIPFSDPIADGPTIQASSQRALDRGITPSAVFNVLSRLRSQRPNSEDLGPPIVLMGYYNPVLRRGLEKFACDAETAGVAGNIVSDLTPDESDAWIAASRAAHLDTIFLTAPTSTDQRLDQVCSRSTGFVYAVSRTGVTGALDAVPPEVGSLVHRIKARTTLPVCVGFGISKPEHVRSICQVADGAVIGSWLVDKLDRSWNNGKGREELVRELRAMKEATKS